MKAFRAFYLCLVCLISGIAAIPARAAFDADAHAKLNQILSRPEFTQWRLRQDGKLPEINVDYPTRFIEQLKKPFRAIRDFIEWFFKGRSTPAKWNHPPSGESLSSILKLMAWVVVGAVAIFLGIVLIKVIGTVPRNQTIANVLSREQIRQAMESGDALALGSSQWMDEARRLAEEQDFRAVYRALYLALLSGLHAAGKIEHNRNRTNWTYVNHYRGPTPERDRFSELTELFDRVWYGRKNAEGNSLEQLRLDVDMLTHAKGAA